MRTHPYVTEADQIPGQGTLFELTEEQAAGQAAYLRLKGRLEELLGPDEQDAGAVVATAPVQQLTIDDALGGGAGHDEAA
jgi:hypothetical protein